MRFPIFPLIALTSLASASLAATICNGDSALCDRLYSNVTYIGAHDSYAVGTSIADNQNKDVTTQLHDGIRALQVQAHNASDGIHLCHTSCSLLDGGTLESYLSEVAKWVSSNPNEVITIVLVNVENLPATSFASAFQSSGLTNHTYTPPSASLALSAWPTLGTLIDAGTTVVVFMDQQANYDAVPYLIDEFANVFEDAYDVTSTNWDCAVNRTDGSAGSQMMLINHFLDNTYNFGGTQFFVPNKDALNVTNDQSSIYQHVGNCQTIWGRNPSIILFDFYDATGNVPLNVAAALNGVAAPTNTITPGLASATSSPSGAAVSSSPLSAAGQQVPLGGSSIAIGLIGIVGGMMSVVL